jgi:type VI secretion system protein ImpI
VAVNMILEVLQVPEWEVGDAWRKVFDTGGGRIGRAFECDWVLSNQYISRHHATVSCQDGVFYIEGIGENGVAINDPAERLPKRGRQALKDGDHLFLDEYEITVAIADTAELSAPQAAEPLLDDVMADVTDFAMPPADPDNDGVELSLSEPPTLNPEPGSAPTQIKVTTPKPAPPLTLAAPWDLTSPLALAPPPPSAPAKAQAPVPRPAPKPTTAPKSTSAPLLSAPVAPPSASNPMPPPPSASTPPLPLPRLVRPPQKAPSVTVAPVSTPGFDGLSFLRGAGLDPRVVPPEMAATLGQIVRAVVQGLIDVLRARAEFRDQFRLALTRVQTSQNNPLKFAVNAEDALGAMLRTSSPGYLSPLEAFEDAFDDIRFHQLAMLAGMRAGFESMKDRFEPKKLMEQSDRHRQGSLSRLGAKGRYWDRYVDVFEELAAHPDTSFQRLYGEEFAEAYEQQLEDLKRNRAKASA